jgi:peptidoglycan/LPS O-acetylase OafA/YrhL
MRYVRSLDGLRAIAIILVMSVHYHQRFGGGWAGVQLFFVISGFLITQILLASKPGVSIGDYMARFYVRRSLRIFPLYFGFVLLLAISAALWNLPPNWPEVKLWLLTYTLNFAHMFHYVPVDDMYTHFWSLAVEEQFYLIWPLIVWCLSLSALRQAIIAILVLSPLLRLLMVATGSDPEQLYFFTPCQMDAFAAGAAIAAFDVRLAHPQRSVVIAAVIAVVAGIAANWAFNPKFAIATGGYPYYMPHYLQYVWGYSLLNICGALAIIGCLQGEFSWLEKPWLVQIGRISYGIYVFHRPVIGLLDKFVAPQLPANNKVAMAIIPVLYIGISYTLALISFNFFESRFLRLKDRLSPAQTR